MEKSELSLRLALKTHESALVVVAILLIGQRERETGTHEKSGAKGSGSGRMFASKSRQGPWSVSRP